MEDGTHRAGGLGFFAALKNIESLSRDFCGCPQGQDHYDHVIVRFTCRLSKSRVYRPEMTRENDEI